MIREFGIELPATERGDMVQRGLGRDGLSIWATVGHRIECICKRGNAGAFRDGQTLLPLGVPGSVPPFVMAASDLLSDSHLWNITRRQDLGPNQRVKGDEMPLRLPERLVVEKDLVRDSDLADVVETGRNIQCIAGIAVPTDLLGEERERGARPGSRVRPKCPRGYRQLQPCARAFLGVSVRFRALQQWREVRLPRALVHQGSCSRNLVPPSDLSPKA